MSNAVRLVNGLSDSYKAKQISDLVEMGVRFSYNDVSQMINDASDSYKANMLNKIKGGICAIPQHCFVTLLSNMSDSYKKGFASECLDLITDSIFTTTLVSCLSNMSDSYKTAFIQVLLPKSQMMSYSTLITMLNGMSDSYKSAFVSTCLFYIDSPMNGVNLCHILSSCSDSYKVNIVISIGDKLVLQSYDDIFAILNTTSDSYKQALTNVLSIRIKIDNIKTHTIKTNKIKMDEIDNKKKNIKNEDEMSDNMLRFVTDAVQTTVKNLCKKEERKSSDEQKSSDCVICLDAAADWLIVPCGHKVCCESCGKTITNCPICRGVKDQLLKVYGQ